MAFYNTIRQEGDELRRSMQNARTQKDKILVYFERRPGMLITPHSVAEFFSLLGYNWPITSVRRAMTDLTTDGHLEKTKMMRAEKLGKPNYCWSLAKRPVGQMSLFKEGGPG